MKIQYIGQWKILLGQSLRLFNLHLPDGRVPTFSVAPGEDLKAKLAEVQSRFAGRKETA